MEDELSVENFRLLLMKMKIFKMSILKLFLGKLVSQPRAEQDKTWKITSKLLQTITQLGAEARYSESPSNESSVLFD